MMILVLLLLLVRSTRTCIAQNTHTHTQHTVAVMTVGELKHLCVCSLRPEQKQWILLLYIVIQ